MGWDVEEANDGRREYKAEARGSGEGQATPSEGDAAGNGGESDKLITANGVYGGWRGGGGRGWWVGVRQWFGGGGGGY